MYKFQCHFKKKIAHFNYNKNMIKNKKYLYINLKSSLFFN